MIRRLLDYLRHRAQAKWRQDVIDSEPMTDHPVHPDILDRIVRNGGYDIGRDRRPVESEMEYVKQVIDSL